MKLFNPILLGLIVYCSATSATTTPDVGNSPWGKNDELGRLNMMTAEGRATLMANTDWQQVYDLAVDYYVGMPSWQAAGDPHYQFWMTHTPNGAIVDNVLQQGTAVNQHVSYSGSAFSMYTHTGTHIDALSHFGLNGKIYNHFSAVTHLGDKGWQKAGAETLPPIIARGVLVDIPASKSLTQLPDNYRISAEDIKTALAKQNTRVLNGDVVLIRTGRMRQFEQPSVYMNNAPGLGMSAAKYLAEEAGAMVLGADNLSFEAFPAEINGNYVPVHTYLLAQKGIPIIELAYLEELAKDKVYEFAFVAASLKLRGADASPFRPIAVPLTHSGE
ncbi:cyclase family protein [Aestuariibacter halophilus]|uniref:Cyclase family protein n=1 Tax=Fluctibacter halophilus TaxID=226011 RepID=A0ABS8G6C3_9ALTE|nr:cyclase family protein [Aestuariibacter halophilus]MCC2616090.1 cyclase family protein [Aestuariibacter halophilus]